MFISRTMKIIFSLSTILSILLLFQNCGEGYSSSQETASSVTRSSNQNNVLENNAEENININTGPEIENVIPGINSSSNNMNQKALLNFVAGDKASCESSVRNRLGEAISCIRGGGCGISCGMPGSNCISANIQHFGLCVEIESNGTISDFSDGAERILANQTKGFNFVAGDKASCESSVFRTLGERYTCLRGGGCGISCGMPGSNCPSANPQHFGLCVQTNNAGSIIQVSQGSTQIQTSTSQLYNFVAGDKSTCEASIRNRLGITVSCSKGGGCGISCGVPGNNCPSANPQHFGACFRH